MNHFTEQQQKAIQHKTGPALVIAGPGAGKTSVLTERIKKLLCEDAKILAITFTKAASEEMTNRVFPERILNNQVRIGTFHSVFYEFLREFDVVTNEKVVSEEERLALFRNILPSVYSHDRDGCLRLLSKYDFTRNKSGDISAFFDEEGTDISPYIKLFQMHKALNNCIDFEDMQFMLKDYLRENPEKALKLKNIYDYILVDEFQDINPIQYEILMDMVNDSENLFVVGDEDQSIYGFRGSDPGFILRFQKDFPKTSVYNLFVNFRSTEEIVNIASKFVSNNQFRIDKQLSSFRGKGEKVYLYHTFSRSSEFMLIRDLLYEKHKSGIGYKDMAVLYRTNSEGEAFARCLTEAGLPYILADQEDDFINNPILQYLFSFYRIAEKQSYESLEFVASNFGIADVYLKEVSQCQNPINALADLEGIDEKTKTGSEELLFHIQKIQKMINHNDFPKTIMYIYLFAGGKEYAKYIMNKGLMNQSIVNEILFRLESVLQDAKDPESLLSLLKMKSSDAIHLCTFHSAKGLEYKMVCCIEVSRGILPHWKSVTEEEAEEERRLLYVGMTRAKDILIISGHAMNMKNRSIFINELEKI